MKKIMLWLSCAMLFLSLWQAEEVFRCSQNTWIYDFVLGQTSNYWYAWAFWASVIMVAFVVQAWSLREVKA